MKLTVGTRGRPPRKFPKKAAKKAGLPLSVQQKKQVNTIVKRKQEIKFFDVAGNATPDVLGSVVPWFSIPQGNDASTRVGNDIRVTHLQMNYNLTVGDTYNQVRHLIFQWHEDNAADVPTVAAILSNVGGSTTYINALINYQNKDKFKVLYDRTITIAPGNSPGSTIKISCPYIKVPHTKISFNGALVIGKNIIYQLIVSDSAGIPNPSINTHARLTYRDA